VRVRVCVRARACVRDIWKKSKK